MNEPSSIILSLGAIFLLGMGADYLGRRSPLPRITVLLIFGILIGDQVFALIPQSIVGQFELVSNITLIMVGFLLGGQISKSLIRHAAKSILWISLSAALAAVLIVSFGLIVLGIAAPIAVLLGCISAATAPAATVDLVLESGKQSAFAKKLLAIVALDDVWGLIIFSLGLSLVSLLNGVSSSESRLLEVGQEIFGAVILGVVLGYPAAHLSGRLRPGKPMFSEALGLILFCGGTEFRQSSRICLP